MSVGSGEKEKRGLAGMRGLSVGDIHFYVLPIRFGVLIALLSDLWLYFSFYDWGCTGWRGLLGGQAMSLTIRAPTAIDCFAPSIANEETIRASCASALLTRGRRH